MKLALPFVLLGLAIVPAASRDLRGPDDAIFVVGAFDKPGRVPCPKDMTLLDVIMDHPAKRADLRNVLLIRPDADKPLSLEIDVQHIVLTGDTARNVAVAPGDIVYVRPAARDVAAGLAETIERIDAAAAALARARAALVTKPR